MGALTLEICSIIVIHVSRSETITVLCRVSKLFRRAAEVHLYRTIQTSNLQSTRTLCITLANSPRLALLLESLTIVPVEGGSPQPSVRGQGNEGGAGGLPEEYWLWMKKALANTQRLKYLEIDSQIGPSTACAWIYPKGEGVLQLRILRCDFDWDQDLIAFLNSQSELEDLYILDFKSPPSTPSTITPANPASQTTNIRETTIHDSAMGSLAVLECTFSEAANILVPGRPITHLKTCFSTISLPEKRQEMEALLKSVELSKRSLRALDIADSSYDQDFSMELLQRVAHGERTRFELRYLGTLVLPVEGNSRLRFYGLLMRLPLLQCVEVEVSSWEPPPSSPAALRALASELRIYCPRLDTVVFVLDFDRTLVSKKRGTSSWLVVDDDDDEYHAEDLWREV
ncbi:hypothetical protein BKA70DRAFT_1189502 [Coprinopsis sp. MPI-PUGE-AT-0042]|nr:hypothetical protein BKA70DRAFT_1189502 [Coprinopsis sp. MPI-PUGE-AT-0042]